MGLSAFPFNPFQTHANSALFIYPSQVHLRICFDLDNTLVTYPNVPGDYSTVQPVPNMVALAQWARNNGHTVIVYTARRMLTHKHNVGRVTADIARVTFDTLDKFNIPYDEIIFGKPIADVYIDDRCVSSSVRHGPNVRTHRRAPLNYYNAY